MNAKRLIVLAVAMANLGMLAACGGEGEGSGLDDRPLPTPAVPTPTRISPEQLAQQSAESAGYSLKALAVEDPAQAAAGYQPQPDTRLVAVRVELSNDASDDVLPVDITNAVVSDVNGVTYNAVAGARDGEIEAGELKKGERASGWISFVVPQDAQLKSITYRIGLISTIALTADLPAK